MRISLKSLQRNAAYLAVLRILVDMKKEKAIARLFIAHYGIARIVNLCNATEISRANAPLLQGLLIQTYRRLCRST